jgi:hypothetical protein
MLTESLSHLIIATSLKFNVQYHELSVDKNILQRIGLQRAALENDRPLTMKLGSGN